MYSITLACTENIFVAIFKRYFYCSVYLKQCFQHVEKNLLVLDLKFLARNPQFIGMFLEDQKSIILLLSQQQKQWRKLHFFKYHHLFPGRGENSSWWSQLFNKTEDHTSNRFDFWKIWLFNCSIYPTCGKRSPTLSISRTHLYNNWFFDFHDIQVLEVSFKFRKYLNFSKCS